MPTVQAGHKRRRAVRRVRTPRPDVHLGPVPPARALLRATDNGSPVVVDPAPYIAASRDPGWGAFLDGFLARNRDAWDALELVPRVVAGRDGVRLELHPGLRAGAVPLRSAVTGQVAGGVVVSPRFGWSGVGQVLAATGWGSGPDFLNLPMVPGSGREVPPWVLAGPVLRRLADLLAHMRPGYSVREDVRQHPRGQIIWPAYLSHQLATGRWHQLPCRFSELDADPRLHAAIRWALERLHADLGSAGGTDAMAMTLVAQIVRLLETLAQVPARRPQRHELDRLIGTGLDSLVLRDGLRAIGWVADERGLGGGQTSDGLAWTLPLETLWERYVESVLRQESESSGGRLRAGRLLETTVPLAWSSRGHRALGHLAPDFVLTRAVGVEVIDAKYKSHFAELDASHWHNMADDLQDTMRGDIHQVLAYAATAASADHVTATLIYPVRQTLFRELRALGRDISSAEIAVGARQLTLRLRALAFGPERPHRS